MTLLELMAVRRISHLLSKITAVAYSREKNFADTTADGSGTSIINGYVGEAQKRVHALGEQAK